MSWARRIDDVHSEPTVQIVCSDYFIMHIAYTSKNHKIFNCKKKCTYLFCWKLEEEVRRIKEAKED